MFKKIAFRASAPVFITLFLTAFIAILAACGSGTGGGDPGEDPKPSSSSIGIIDPGLPVDTNKFSRFEFESADLESSDGMLIYTLGVTANAKNDSIKKLDSVVVKLGSKTIKSSGELQNYGYSLSNEQYTFVGEECCNTDCQLIANAYVLGDRTPNKMASNTFKRTKGICAPSSSSTASSSSAAVLSFSQIKFSGADTLTLNSKTGNRGVVLSTGSGTANTSEATIYYDGAGFVAGSNVKIITEFRITPTYSGNIFWAASPDIGYVTTPKNTSDFILRSGDTGRDTEEVSGQYLYYMIRTAPSGDEWNSGDYLVLVSQGLTLGTNGNNFIKILAWKVVQN